MEGNTSGNGNSRPLWAHPWKFRESVLVIFIILATGIALEVLFRGWHLRPISLPYNIYLGISYILFLLFLYFRYKDKSVVKWLSGIPGALSAISLFALMVLLFGSLPQGINDKSLFIKLTGLDRARTSWLFLLSEFFFLTSLGLVVIRRIVSLSVKNIGFVLSHFGLFLIFLAGTLGAGDIKKFGINLLQEGNESSIGVSGQGNMYKLPFSLQLLDFNIEEYNPRLALIDPRSNQFVDYNDKTFPMIEKNLKTQMYRWKINVLNYLPLAMTVDSTVQRSSETGSCPAAFIMAINVVKKDTVKGWILSGSYLQEPVNLLLDATHSLSLTKPEPKQYRSLIVVRTDSTKTDTVVIEVNKPFEVKGWKIYQVGYDQSKGKWSTLSVLEVVIDPWLPVVYTGFFIVMAGTILLFLFGRTKGSIEETGN
jgi:hypothetical protein